MIYYLFTFFFEGYCRHRDLHVLTLSFPTRRSSDLSLPHDQDALIEAVCAANSKTIVVLETGTPVTMPWLDRAAAVLEAWYPGGRGGEARSEERRVGKEGVSTCRSRWSRYH